MHAKKLDKIATAVLYSIAGIIVAILASLILYILVRGLPHISWSFLTGKSSSYQAGGGIGIQLYNSFFLLVITLIISVPLSMGAGIFLAEYAKKGPVTNFVRTCIEILSSLPSAVDRLGKGIWSLEDHSDVLTHLIDVNFWTVDINPLIEDLTCDLSNINGIIHTVETAEVG